MLMTETDEKEVARKERQKARMKRWRAENKDRISEYQKIWRERNAGHVSEYQREYQLGYQNREDVQFAHWVRNLHRNYQMTPDEFNSMWESQDGKCVICKSKMAPRGRSSNAVAVDHNHGTGEVRKLLCRSCNHGLGMFKDDPEVLFSAAEYLIENGYYPNNGKELT
jgi:hypothetical protein